MDIVAPNRLDERRVEVLADGLPLFHGAQLAVDTTLVSVLGRNGEPRPRCADVDGVILEEAKRRKERRYPELSGRHGRTRLVVLAAEVCGRWSPDTVHFLAQLAKEKARHEPRVLRETARQAWLRRWRCLFACSAAQAFALSLLERRDALGATPTTSDVIGDCRHLWWRGHVLQCEPLHLIRDQKKMQELCALLCQGVQGLHGLLVVIVNLNVRLSFLLVCELNSLAFSFVSRRAHRAPLFLFSISNQNSCISWASLCS